MEAQKHHMWDEDGVCIHCGLDGAEWHWWRHNTYEGKAATDDTAKMPLCERDQKYVK